jgi:hypothetical protein
MAETVTFVFGGQQLVIIMLLADLCGDGVEDGGDGEDGLGVVEYSASVAGLLNQLSRSSA